MSKKTITTAPKKKGPLAIAFARIVALEDKAAAPHSCSGPVARQYTGRVIMPNFGIPLPAGVGFHGYVKTRLEDDVIGDQVTPPAEADVMALLRIEADEQYPGHVGLELADISVLPEGWATEGK